MNHVGGGGSSRGLPDDVSNCSDSSSGGGSTAVDVWMSDLVGFPPTAISSRPPQYGEKDNAEVFMLCVQ